MTEKCLATSSPACDDFYNNFTIYFFLFRQKDEKKNYGFDTFFNNITAFATSKLILEESFLGQFLFEINPVISFYSHKPTFANLSFSAKVN